MIKGLDKAMDNAIRLGELLKHRVKGLHQVTKISRLELIEEYQPLYEGLDRLVFKTAKPIITLTFTKKALDLNDPGY